MKSILISVAAAVVAGGAFAAGPAWVSGRVRRFPETRVAYGTAPREAFSFYAVKLAEESLAERLRTPAE